MDEERERELEVREFAESREEEEHAEADRIERQETRRPHTWGGLRTWFILGIVIVGAIVHSLAIRYLVGGEIMRPEQWNLGHPPTAPH